MTEATIDEFNAYEGVRKSGITNMFNVGLVCKLSGLERDKVIFIMHNYDHLRKEAEKKEKRKTEVSADGTKV